MNTVPKTLRIDGAAKQSVETGRTRLLVAGAVFALGFATVAARLVLITLGADPEAPRLGSAAAETPPVVSRADVVDRNGVLLATSLPTVGLFADARLIDDPQRAAQRLTAVLPGLDPIEVTQKLSSGMSFVWLSRTLTPHQQAEVNRLGIPGLEFQPSERRVYPQGRLAVHVLGATDVDNRGLTGVERSFDQRLSQNRLPLTVSLDVRVQHVLAAELRRAMHEFDAIGAGGAVLDVRTGEVLAMVSYPDFEPNDIGSAEADARFNRMTLGVYELGSTFKLFNTALALDSGKVGIGSRFDATFVFRLRQ